MTDPRAFVRGLGTTAAVLGTLAFVVGAPTRPQRAWHDGDQRQMHGDKRDDAGHRDEVDVAGELVAAE